MRVPIIAGNWKMHKTPSETAAFLQSIKASLKTDGVETVICAPFTSLSALSEGVRGSFIQAGAQNLHWEDSGAFTGEVSGPMLKELGVKYVIVGHSERREYFNETDETVNRKVHAAFRHGLIPIVCVGEKLEERQRGQTMAICRRQTLMALEGLTPAQVERTVIAYEPVWAIGTGQSSTAEDANAVIGAIRQTVAERFGTDASEKIRIQYGGSVKPDNISEFMRQPHIDGALVGGASLDPTSFLQLIEGAIMNG